MSGWVAEPPTQPTLENGALVVAGMGRRLAAWIVDAVVSSFLIIIPLSFAIGSRAVTVNSDVIDKLASDKTAFINEPLLSADTNVVWLVVAGWILLRAAYFAGGWTVLGGTLGQRLLSVEVAAVENPDRRLPALRAILRWIALEGVGQTATAVALALVIQLLASQPFSMTSYGSQVALSGVAVSSQDRAASALSSLASLGSLLWSILLLGFVAANALNRGLHDRVSGSIVLGNPPRDWQDYERWGRMAVLPSYGQATSGYSSATYRRLEGYPSTGGPLGSGQPGGPDSGPAQPPPTQPSSTAYGNWPPIPPKAGPTA